MRKFTVYYEKAVKGKQAAVIHKPRFVNKHGADVQVPNHTMDMREAIIAMRFVLANRFNKERPTEGTVIGGDRITIEEVFD